MSARPTIVDRLERRAQGLLLVVASIGLLPRPGEADEGSDPHLDAAATALAGWDLPTARKEASAAPEGAAKDVKLGIIAIYEGNYDEAQSLLSAALASGELGKETAEAEEAEHFLGLARGSQRALADAVTVTSPDGHVEAVFADEKDALIAPYLFEAMATAREALGDDLGVRPPEPIRFEFLDDPLKLAMVTPLTTENIRTTGTVGVTKYRRIMMISPRVMVYGYGWIDTAVHEYVHYLLTIRTGNQAPVWLQEGLAKLLETRWRRTEPEPLDAAIAARLHRAIVRDELVTLDEMYPSVAMLPSQELAALAYAEVQTMLELVHTRRGPAGIAKLLDAVAAGDDAKDALASAWGDSFEGFMVEWKKATKKKTARSPGGELDRIQFADGDSKPAEQLSDVFSHLGGGRARQHARLGTLLQARDHDIAAAAQYEKARKADKRAKVDPVLSRRLGRLYVRLGQFEPSLDLLQIAAKADPEDANLAADQGRALLQTGDRDAAQAALWRAIRVNPFIPGLHCDLAELTDDPARRKDEQALCRR